MPAMLLTQSCTFVSNQSPCTQCHCLKTITRPVQGPTCQQSDRLRSLAARVKGVPVPYTPTLPGTYAAHEAASSQAPAFGRPAGTDTSGGPPVQSIVPIIGCSCFALARRGLLHCWPWSCCTCCLTSLRLHWNKFQKLATHVWQSGFPLGSLADIFVGKVCICCQAVCPLICSALEQGLWGPPSPRVSAASAREGPA